MFRGTTNKKEGGNEVQLYDIQKKLIVIDQRVVEREKLFFIIFKILISIFVHPLQRTHDDSSLVVFEQNEILLDWRFFGVAHRASYRAKTEIERAQGIHKALISHSRYCNIAKHLRNVYIKNIDAYYQS